ncbi:MAG: glycosyltransferase family protein [Oscillospiraceae bacterium]|nr:glycosyltransferase family protein [Oscillospiraceae bacterium]
MMKYLAIIQARCGSSRLPNKVMKDLAGKAVIERMVERVQKSKKIDEVIVATSIADNNLPLIELCARRRFRVFVGSEKDVLDRYYQAAKLFNPEYIIRVTADCPLIDYHLVDQMIECVTPETDYVHTDEQTFPVGLGAEIVKFSVLEQIWRDAKLKSEREHVTLFIPNNCSRYKIQTLKFPIDGVSDKRLTLDHPEDYELISIIYNHFAELGLQDDFYAKEILEFLEVNPELTKINSHIDRFEGLKISLANDGSV